MKNLFLFITLIAISFASLGQVASKIRTLQTVEAGHFAKLNPSKFDTLKSNDTLAYVIPVTHANLVLPLVQQKFKLVAGDTTVTVKFFESIDNITYYAVVAGASPSAYTKTVTATNNYSAEYNGNVDLEYFDAIYLKIMYISKTKSTLKTIPYGYIKFNVK